jgi:hypothetical protein
MSDGVFFSGAILTESQLLNFRKCVEIGFSRGASGDETVIFAYNIKQCAVLHGSGGVRCFAEGRRGKGIPFSFFFYVFFYNLYI